MAQDMKQFPLDTILSVYIIFIKVYPTTGHLSGVKNRSTVCYTHDLLPPMLARGFRDLHFGFRGPCLVEILFRGTSATYFSKVLIR